LVLILSVLGFGLLFLSPYELESTLDDTCCTSFEAHLWGMVASLAVSGAGVVYFIQRLRRDEMHLRNLLEHARSVKRESDAHRNLAALAAGLAHELATPLGTIAVVAKDIEHAAASCGRLPMSSSASDARLILAEVGRCREVIERVASQSRSSGAEVPETIPLRDLPNLLVPFLAQQSLERVRWALPNSTAFLPKARFLQALAVLLKNAVEAGGEEQPVVHVTAQIAEKRLRIEVQDRGRGMPPEVLERLGEPFFSTKAEHGAGTGLGLFLCRVFCASVNGSLSFVSSPGKGTTAILDLPVDCAQPHVRSSHAPAS
jgi:two-component system sensor histidine kinase RegB